MSYINIIIIYADVQNYNYIDVSGIFFFILGVFRSQDTPSTMAMDNDDNEKIRWVCNSQWPSLQSSDPFFVHLVAVLAYGQGGRGGLPAW